ncbi:MAG: hypothetical protein ACR2KK_01865 [Acidimicrobiales bacterium]
MRPISTVDEIVAVLGELSLLRQGDPDALARREEILATKAELVERIRAEDEGPVAVVVPSSDDDATMCPVCGCAFVVTGKRRYCSDRCRRTAWARRHHSPPAVVVVPAPAGSRRPHTVYECDACGLRALGEHRCEDCGTFMRRVGLGGPCPSCDDPVAAGELIDVVEVTGRRR